MGDTHLVKRKYRTGRRQGDPKRQKKKGKQVEQPVSSDASTDDGEDEDEDKEGDESPPYQESQDSSSAGDGGDDDDSGDDGAAAGGGAGGGSGAGGSGFGGAGGSGFGGAGGLRFTGEMQFTHATQDRDHGPPESQRRAYSPTDYADTPQYSSTYSDSLYAGGYAYPVPNISSQPATRWVYEWEDPSFYNMLVQEWETTAHWTGQSWIDYKAQLQARGFALMSIAEYEEACRNGIFPYILRQ